MTLPQPPPSPVLDQSVVQVLLGALMAATMKPSLERNIQLGFAVALATVIAAGAATLRSAAATGEGARWVGQALVQQLRRLTDDNPSQRHRVDSLAAVALAGLAVSEA